MPLITEIFRENFRIGEAIEYRRSVRKYLDAELDEEKVKTILFHSGGWLYLGLHSQFSF